MTRPAIFSSAAALCVALAASLILFRLRRGARSDHDPEQKLQGDGVRASALIALLGAALLAGCGGETASTAPSEASTPTVPPTSAPQEEGSVPGRQGQGSKHTPPYQGGEKSIEEFGSEAEGSDRSALLGAFRGYLAALADRDYASACLRLSATVKHSLEQFAAHGSAHATCEAILPSLLSPGAAAIARDQAAGKVTKVRVRGDRAFVVFHAPGAKLYQLTMARDAGQWHAALLIASVLIPSAATLGQ